MSHLREELVAWIEHMEADARRERREAQEREGVLKDEIKKARYVLRGMCGERLSLRVSISETAIGQSRDVWEMAQFMVENHAKRAAQAIEDQLGGRHDLIEAYMAAAHHINYLEAHAASRGLMFEPYLHKANIS